MTETPQSVPDVENPAEVLRNENGVFEVMSPYGYVFQVTCRPGTRMGIREISEPKSAKVTQGTIWRIRAIVMPAPVLSILAALFFQVSVLPQPAVAATATAESVPSAGANASNPESSRNITDTSESGATSPHEAVAESKEESIAFLPEHLVPEPASPVSGSAALRAASAMAFTLPITINSAPTKAVPDHRTRKIWLGLSFAEHSGAAFDAWTTRRALSQDNAHELNPLLRPFARNASLYGAIQVGPTILDLLSRRMMTSKHDWLRRSWWILQVASATVSFASGAHNLSLQRAP